MVRGKLQNLRDLSHFHLRILALDLGMLGGCSDYCRFIILGTARAGSNFLRGLLHSHSQIVAFGELFRFYDSIGWDLPNYDRYLQCQRLTALMQRDPSGFLEQKVFRRFPRQISAVGFKMFYYHAQDDSRKSIWTFLRNQKDLKVIHLKRNNTLRLILSLKKAHQTNKWTNTTGVGEENLAISLDYEECLKAFTEAPEIKRQFDIYFEGHHKIDVFYRDLSSNYESEMRRIQEFLGVDYEVVKPTTYRQSNLPLSEAISNYLELKRRFRGTPWEEFFED